MIIKTHLLFLNFLVIFSKVKEYFVDLLLKLVHNMNFQNTYRKTFVIVIFL